MRAHDLTDRTRLRIPLLVGEDCIHGHSFFEGATIYPTQLGMAATWDPDLVERVARATAVEVAATGVHWTFSPVLCIARDLRWGRVGETFGEDPYLIGELAAAMVRGYQGEGLTDPTAILACAKHFAGYSETQGGRDASEADISRRKLRSWFLPPFERVARAGCRTFMLGYQTMDGVPITVNGWLLDDVLRGEWGYGGMLVTDWDNVGRMVWEQQVQPDHAHAAAAAVRAGNDLVMTTPQFFQGALDAVEQGLLTEADLDPAVARILTVKMELGLFEDVRRPDVERQRLVVGSAEHAELNLEVARRSVVLLRNDGTLPLPADGRPRRVAVVGPLADDAQTQLGDWAGSSGQADWLPDGHPREMITTVLDGLRAHVPDGLDRHPRPRRRDPHPRSRSRGRAVPRRPAAPAGGRAGRARRARARRGGGAGARRRRGRRRRRRPDRARRRGPLDRHPRAGRRPGGAARRAGRHRDARRGGADGVQAAGAAGRGARRRPRWCGWRARACRAGARWPRCCSARWSRAAGCRSRSRGTPASSRPTTTRSAASTATRYADLTQRPAFAFGEGLSYSTYADLVVEQTSRRTTRSAPRSRDQHRHPPVLETVQVYVSDR